MEKSLKGAAMCAHKLWVKSFFSQTENILPQTDVLLTAALIKSTLVFQGQYKNNDDKTGNWKRGILKCSKNER
jgi:hypothetical protein